MWDLTPTLVGDVVRLEPLAPEHHDGLRAVSTPPEIWAYWPVNPGTSDGAFDRWFEGCLDAREHEISSHFATVLVSSGQAVGSTSFCTIRPQARAIEIGWTWLTPSAWGTGANTEAKLLALTHAFDVLDCVRVDFDTDAENARSRAALGALPAQFEGVLRNFSIRETDGSVRSSAIYSVTDDEWPDVRANLAGRLERHERSTGS
jgi:RimJ/RimL family protein N-acetyltransferase